jgi:hypothetical protein
MLEIIKQKNSFLPISYQDSDRSRGLENYKFSKWEIRGH